MNVVAFGQKGVTTFGLQYKPIIPNRYIGMFEQNFDALPLEASMKQKYGNVIGGIVRHGLTKGISLETGIKLTQRNFNTFFDVPDSGVAATDDVRLVSYSIPVSGMVFIRLSDQIYMSTSLGAAMTIFLSKVQVLTPIPSSNNIFLTEAIYNSKINGAMIADLGFEWRTKKSGTFYIGGSYNLPFTNIAKFALAYEYTGGDFVSVQDISGSFATVDVRYYFNERKEKKVGETDSE